LDFEKGTVHHHFRDAEEIPLRSLAPLGKGGFGFVDRVRSEVTFKEFARKQIMRGPTFQRDKGVLKDFENELSVLRRLSHRHIINLVGSYTDPRFVGILMHPVADCNLKEYLEGSFEASFLCSYFGCLTSAVSYLHENSIRHKDIKPQNVLVKDHRIILTDFGISRDSTGAQSTTSGPTVRSPRYCSPEVALGERRSYSSDIWSLGCIFYEIWTVLAGYKVADLNEFFQNHGSKSICYHSNLQAVASWKELAARQATEQVHNAPLDWIANMLLEDRELRWSALKLAEIIQETSELGDIAYTGLCCNVMVGSPETMGSVESLSIGKPLQCSPGPIEDANTRQDEKSIDLKENDSTDRELPLMLSGRGTAATITATASERSTQTQVKKRKWSSTHSARKLQKQPPVLETVPSELPSSFIMAQSNLLSREAVLSFVDPSGSADAGAVRSTRAKSRGKLFEDPYFNFGDGMFPNVFYADTCLKSKASPNACWTTLQGLVEHMTPGILRGYTRYCPKPQWGIADSPTIVATGLSEDVVHGVIIFGIHSSQDHNRSKYECDYEADKYEPIEINLQGGGTMEVVARTRVWKEDMMDQVKPYDVPWDPLTIVGSGFYTDCYKLTQREEEALSHKEIKDS
jgi:serine/threonine protein kinase